MEEKQLPNTLLDLLASLRKHLFGMTVIFIGTVLLVTIYTFTQTPIYEVASSLMIRYGREYVYRSMDQVQKGDVQPLLTYQGKEVINTELEIFRSNELAEKVIKTLGVEKLFPELSEKTTDEKLLLSRAINRFRKQLNVFHVKESSVIGVTFQHEDPEIAVQAVNILTDLFKELHLKVFMNPQSEFLEKQVVAYGQHLQDSEQELKTFRQQNQIFSLEDQQKIFMQQYTTVKTYYIEESSTLEAMAEKAADLEKQLESIPEVVVQYEESALGNNIDDAAAKLLNLKLQERDLLEKYPESNRLVQAVRRNIKLVETFIDGLQNSSRENVRKGSNPVYQQLEKELATTRAEWAAQAKKIAVIQQQMNRLSDQLQQLTENENKLKFLTLRVETTEAAYKNFLSRLEDSRIQNAMDQQKMVNVVVIEKPMLPVKPIKPNKKMNILVGVILGVAAGLFYTIFTEYVMVRKPSY